MRKILFSLLAFCAIAASAQVTTDPAIIEKDYKGQIVLTFDPTLGNGGMASATECYSHIGLITAESTSNSDWKFVQTPTGWGTKNEPKWTKVGNKWQLTINNMFSFFNCPESTDIVAIAMVFHDGNGSSSKQGKTASEGDILIFLGEEQTPDDPWEGFTPAAPTSQKRPDGIDQGIYYGEDGTSVTLCTYAASKTEAAKHVFLLGDMTDWKLSNDYQLKKDGNYFWIHLDGLEKGKQYRFQYAVVRADGVKKQISDLFSELLIHPDDSWEPRELNPDLIGYPLKGADGSYVTVIQPGKPKFEWSDATLNFQRPNKDNLIIYELWVYDYTPEKSIPGLMKRLDYLQSLGVNAIELMPVTEFDGNQNWGYSPNHYFALDKAYGLPEQLKTFIDECHKRGIAVILDMVFNHATGLNPMNKLYPYGTDLANNPWFNVTSPHKAEDGGKQWYEDWNHDFQPTKNMFKRALQYWLKEYKVDGFRMDISHGFCGENCDNRYENLKEYNKAVKDASPNAYFIQEFWGSWPAKSTIISDGMLCWTGNGLSSGYCQVAMGWLKPDMGGNTDAFNAANNDGYVSYAESHDEERMQYKAKKWGADPITVDEAARIRRVASTIAFNVLLNGSHMLWQYEEVGYDFSINCDIEHPDGDKEDYRCNPKPRPEKEGYFSNPNRVDAYKKCAQLIQLRTRILPTVFEGNPTAINVGSGVKVRSVQWGSDVYVVANFDPKDAQTATLPNGTWYDYFAGGTQAASSYSLQAGEVKIFTGSQITPPEIQDPESMVAIENVFVSQGTNAQKILRNGQILIVRGDMIYDITGRRVE